MLEEVNEAQVKIPLHKFTIAGPCGVGKTSILRYIDTKEYTTTPVTTIGCAFLEIKFRDRIFQVWDTAGQERYKSLAPTYYRRGDVIMFTFEVNRAESLDEMVDYIRLCYDALGSETQFKSIIIIGNKTDLPHRPLEELTQRFRLNETICKYQLTHLEPIYVSAFDGSGINDLVEAMKLSSQFIEKIKNALQDDIQITSENNPDTGGTCC
jgi:small GTP-binding protein